MSEKSSKVQKKRYNVPIFLEKRRLEENEETIRNK